MVQAKVSRLKSRLLAYKRPIRNGAIFGMVVGSLVVAGLYLFTGTPPKAQASGERDCEPTSVIWCGALSVDELVDAYNSGGPAGHQYSDIAAIYNAFGISADDVNSLKQHVAMGQVKADGNVFLNGVQIGTGATTAGRVQTAHSTAIAGTGAFMRPPSDSFAQPTTVIDAFIGFDANGQPAWAILASCGNPIIWQMPKTHLVKQVQDPVTGQFVKDATFNNGATATYKLTVSNTGQGSDSNTLLTDVLPDRQTFVAGSTKDNGQPAADGLMSGGLSLGTMSPGQTAEITFQTQINVSTTSCGKNDMVNTATIKSDHLPNGQSDTATTHVVINCQTISTICTSLSAPATTVETGQTLTFSAVGAAQGTTITSYVFSVDNAVAQTSTSSQFVFLAGATGTHTVSVVVRFANGASAGGSGSCAAPVTVSAAPAPPPAPPAPTPPPLPNTGLGTTGMVGIFVGTSGLAGVGYYLFAAYRRRLS